MSRRGILKFRPLVKLISGKPVSIDLSSFGFLSAPKSIANSEEPLNLKNIVETTDFTDAQSNTNPWEFTPQVKLFRMFFLAELFLYPW